MEESRGSFEQGYRMLTINHEVMLIFTRKGEELMCLLYP